MTRRKWFAMGDPQAPFERVLEVLRAHDLLDDADRLRADRGLVSMGDHFDFPPREGQTLAQASQDGTTTLSWLAAHPPEQVVILFGNHDAARVMELAWETDASFAEARRMAREAPDSFHEAFPRIPTPAIAERDYSCFAEHQRRAVQRLLVEKRLQLGVVGLRGGMPMLLTHAGVTEREVELLGVGTDPAKLASALARHLGQAVEHVRASWQRGDLRALDLRPLHEAGTTGVEGGGLLYHRASLRGEADWRPGPAPRRYHPTRLPRGLVQVCGHTGHHKSLEELDGALLSEDAKARKRGGLRTLAVGASGVRYHGSVVPAERGEATMYLVDPEMARLPVSEIPLFELDEVIVPSEEAAT